MTISVSAKEIRSASTVGRPDTTRETAQIPLRRVARAKTAREAREAKEARDHVGPDLQAPAGPAADHIFSVTAQTRKVVKDPQQPRGAPGDLEPFQGRLQLNGDPGCPRRVRVKARASSAR